MKIIKKLLAAALVLSLAISMSGCSGSDKTETEPVEEVKEPPRTLEMEEGTDYGIEIYNENGRQIIVSQIGVGDDPNICRFFFNTEASAEDEIMEIPEVRIWQESVPFSAFVDKPREVRYLLKAGKCYFIQVCVDEEALNGHELADCDDFEMDVKWGESTFSVTIPVDEVTGTAQTKTLETTEEPTTEEATTAEPKEIVPAYYEEQTDIPTVDSVTLAGRGGGGALGPTENGKYLEKYYSYRTNIDGKDRTDDVISEYLTFVAEQGFSIQEVNSADDYAVLNANYRHGSDENEKEIYHLLKDEKLAAVLSFNDKIQSLYIYLMDAWAPGTRPDPAVLNAPKNTAYKSGTVYMAAFKRDPYSVYDFKFVDGILVSVEFENDDGKGGFLEDSEVGVEYSKFNGMTVEEISEMLEDQGYKITIGDDLFDVMMRSISD